MMKLLLFAFLAGAAWASDVLEFTDDDFDSRIGEHPLVLVEFFAPWCGHCKRLAPEFEAAATRLKGIASLAKVDCTVSTDVCAKNKISGYPTLNVFRDGEDSGGYEGPRTADGIVGYLKMHAGPPSQEIKTAAELEKYVGGKHTSVVGFFADAGSDAQAEYTKAANLQRMVYRFAHTNSKALLKKYDIKGEGVVIFRPPHLSSKFEDSTVAFSDEFTSSNINEFIEDNIFGLCPQMTEDNKDRLRSKDLLIAYYDLDYENNVKGSNYWRNRVMKVAKGFTDQGKALTYCVANKMTFESELLEIRLDINKETPLVVIRSAEGNSYIMKAEFSRDGKALESFLEDYFDGKVKRFIKSEPIPEDNDGPVKVVVGHSFDAIVDDKNKDVLIEFYAPWCSHCKTLEPKFEELGERLSDDPNIIIAKMDATVNSVPFGKYVVQGFPTIYFSPAKDKQNPIPYEGGRDVSDFISFLEKEATNPLVLKEPAKKKKKKKKAEL